jgi:hypothetical protein
MPPWVPGTSCSWNYASNPTVASDTQERPRILQSITMTTCRTTYANSYPMRSQAHCFCAFVVLALAQTQSPEERCQCRLIFSRTSLRGGISYIGNLTRCMCDPLVLYSRAVHLHVDVIRLRESLRSNLPFTYESSDRLLHYGCKHHASARACRTRKMSWEAFSVQAERCPLQP